MLVIDKSKENLLSMKEKELEIGDNKEIVLSKYKELACEIDDEMYNTLIDRIEHTDIHNLSLEEQLVILSEIEKDYTFIDDKQKEFKNVYHDGYQRVTGSDEDDLVLNDLSNILIDDIRNRLRVVQGYLINIKSIRDNKKALEALNLRLIEESKKKDNILSNYKELENELKNAFLTTEGRNYDVNGNLIYNSIVNEYKNFDIDLKKLFDDSDLLNRELERVNEAKKSSDEELLAAQMCYERIPSDANKEIFESIKRDNAYVNYELVLLYMANLVAHEYTEYTSIVLKRKQILSLNDERRHCLDELGVKVSIDPFERVRLNEQLDIVVSLGNNDDEVEIIKRNIGNLDELVETKTSENNEYMLELEHDISLLREDFKFSNQLSDYAEGVLDANNPSKVINVKDKSPNMNMRRVEEQTTGVINRVYTMLHEEDNAHVAANEVNPTLVLEPFINEEVPVLFEDTNKAEKEEIFPEIEANNDAQVFVSEKANEVFPDINQITPKMEEVSVLPENKQSEGNELVFPEIEVNNEAQVFANEKDDVVFPEVADNKEEVVKFDDNVIPFENVSLYNDRADDDVFETKKDSVLDNNLVVDLKPDNQNNIASMKLPEDNSIAKMPDVFWNVDDGNNGGMVEDNKDNITQFDDVKVKTLKNVS